MASRRICPADSIVVKRAAGIQDLAAPPPAYSRVVHSQDDRSSLPLAPSIELSNRLLGRAGAIHVLTGEAPWK